MQLRFNLNKDKHGGRRTGSGRKRIHSKGVAHRVREKISLRTPMHINFRYKTSIRNKECLRLLKSAIINARRMGLKVIHFSLQHNHIHLIVEADNNTLLTSGMRSLTITFAKGLKQGRVQVERYHLHVLKTIRETKNAVKYVLFNKQKHEKGRYSKIDEYCSLLSVKNWQILARQFAKESLMILRIERTGWSADDIKSYLLKRSLSELTACFPA